MRNVSIKELFYAIANAALEIPRGRRNKDKTFEYRKQRSAGDPALLVGEKELPNAPLQCIYLYTWQVGVNGKCSA